MIGTNLTVGIEFGLQRARIAVVQLGSTPQVLYCEELNVPPGDEHRLGALCAEALNRLGAKKADVHLAFSPAATGAMRHGLFVTPRLKGNELKQVALRELKKDALAKADASYLAAEPLDAFQDEQVEKQVNLLVAVDKDTVDQPASALLDGKCIVRTATSSSLALWRLASALDLPATSNVCAIVQTGARRSSLLVLEQGIPRFLRDIPTTFGRGKEEDEHLLAEALARELDLSLVYFAQQHRPRHVDTVVVVGDTELAESISDWIEDGGRYHVVRFADSGKLAVAQTAPDNLLPYAVAIGAALGPKTRVVPDVLPSELRAKPERVYALAAGSVVLVLLILVMVLIRGGRLSNLEVGEERLRIAESAFNDMEKTLSSASTMDGTAARAAIWQAQFDAHDAYHKQLASLLHKLPTTVPDMTYLHTIKLSAFERDARALVKPDTPQWKLTVNGAVLAEDLKEAQTDLKRLVDAFEALPTVKGIDLKPIKAPLLVGGNVELPFSFDAALVNPFPARGVL